MTNNGISIPIEDSHQYTSLSKLSTLIGASVVEIETGWPLFKVRQMDYPVRGFYQVVIGQQ